MRKGFSGNFLMLVVGLGVVFTLCQAMEVSAQEKPIVIGGTLPLTGTFSATGKWVEKGYQFWADEVNAKGGVLRRPVKLIIYDDKSDAKEAVACWRRHHRGQG